VTKPTETTRCPNSCGRPTGWPISTKKEIIRLLKRAIARESFRCLTTTVTVPGIADLRPLRQSKNITLTAAAGHFGVWPATISTPGAWGRAYFAAAFLPVHFCCLLSAVRTLPTGIRWVAALMSGLLAG
jgi:hypothetical protein